MIVHRFRKEIKISCGSQLDIYLRIMDFTFNIFWTDCLDSMKSARWSLELLHAWILTSTWKLVDAPRYKKMPGNLKVHGY